MSNKIKANHQANIVRITEIKEHTNADNLEIIPIGEYQVVSRKNQFKVGDLGVYIQPDSVVPQTEAFKFIWQDFVVLDGTVPEKRRRITVRKFRKEWSEGLLLPITDFPTLYEHTAIGVDLVGQDVSGLLGITHYDPEPETGETSNAPKLKRKYPHSIRGWYNFLMRKIRNLFGIGRNTDGSSDNISLGIPVYDIKSRKNYNGVFIEGERVKVTEKIHGSNARYIFLDGVMYAGSRQLWKSASSNCIFRRALKELPWIEEWCRSHEGHVLWGEVTPTQGEYKYGSDNPQFFVFDVRLPDGKWAEEDSELIIQLQAHAVPTLYCGPYDELVINKLVEGKSTLDKHLREGVVIKTVPERHVRGVGRAQLKVVSNAFLEKDNK